MWRILGLLWLALGLASTVAVAQQETAVRITWYLPTGRPMANGEWPYPGAAACSWNYPLGTRLRLRDGLEVVCADRGLLGARGWVDLFAPTASIGAEYARRYGDYTLVTVLDRLDAATAEDDDS